ncbi:MAG TPA: START domain-containing protein [Bacteroidia bacterium]
MKKYENGIAIYTRSLENSPYKELKSVVKLQTTLSSVVSILTDWTSYPEWVYRCGESSTLKKTGATDWIHYQTVVAPWPVDSRDFVVRVRLNQDPESKIVKIISESIPDYIPKTEDKVRIREFRASWTLTPINGEVEVVYELMVNPGGYVPAWLINLAVVDGPYETTRNLMDRIKNTKHREAKFPYIKD